MRITKFGHSCLLIEEGSARILLDPGKYSTLQNNVENLDAILITHEHQDHCDLDSLQAILAKNPKTHIFTNPGVGQKLVEANVVFDVLGDSQSITVNGVLIEGFGQMHAEIYPTFPRVHNTGYRIAKKFFYGGDSLDNVVECEVLAYPAVAPWMRVAQTIDYANAIKPKICFPVHDAFLKITGPFYLMPEKLLNPEIKWLVIEEGKSIEV